MRDITKIAKWILKNDTIYGKIPTFDEVNLEKMNISSEDGSMPLLEFLEKLQEELAEG